MFRYTAAVVLALMLGASTVTSANVERVRSGEVAHLGADSQDVMPAVGGGIEVHACRGLDESGPYNVVEFGPGVAGDASGAHVIVGDAPAGACAHLVVFTQPEPNQAS